MNIALFFVSLFEMNHLDFDPETTAIFCLMPVPSSKPIQCLFKPILPPKIIHSILRIH